MSRIEFPLRVMEPCLVETLPEGDYIFQVKWDGMRWVAWCSTKGYYFQTKQGRVFSRRFPELLPSMEWLPAESILDGEVVVLRNGRPHFPSLLRRIHTSSSVVNSLPDLSAEYIVFDLLYWKGKDLRQRPLTERLELLSTNMPKVPRCYPIENFSDGVVLWQHTKKLSLEGIVAKGRYSPYLPGKNCLWQKLKHWKSGEFYIGGVKFRNRIPTAVCLGTFLEEDFIYIGSVAQGIKKLAWEKIKDYGQSESPFSVNKPQIFSSEEIIWVKPVFPVKVRFLEWTDEGKLRHGQII